jgi:hypothetical protein
MRLSLNDANRRFEVILFGCSALLIGIVVFMIFLL